MLFVLNGLICVFLALGYRHLFKYGNMGYAEAVEGYIFLLLFSSPVVIMQLYYLGKSFIEKRKNIAIFGLFLFTLYVIVPFTKLGLLIFTRT